MSRATPTDRDLEELLRTYGGRLSALAWSLTGHRQDAEDLLQETFAQAIHRWERVVASRSVGAYLRTMMVNQFLTGRRRAASREVVSDAAVRDHEEAVVVDLDAAWTRDHLVRLVTRLPPRQRAVVVLRFLEELSVTETAEALRMSTGAVRSNTHRALRSLRGELEPEEDGGVAPVAPSTA